MAWANPKDLENDGYSHVFTVRSEQPGNVPSVPLYTAPVGEVVVTKADAERYRHIRENADTMHWENMLKADIETLEDIDAAIDAARTAKPEMKK